MTTLSESYMREIASQWGYLVTWLPGRTVELGQTGEFDGMQVHVDGNLEEDDISIEEMHDQTESELEYNSAGAVTYGWSAGAAAVTGEKAELHFSFSRANAVLLHLYGAVEHRVAGLRELKRSILDLDENSAWPKRRAVIVSVARAESTTLLISSERGATVQCRANAGQALGNLADPRLALERTAAKSMHTASVCEGGLTPLYQALVLRKGLLGSRRLERALRGPESIDATDPLRELVDEDFALCTVGPPEDPAPIG